MWKVEFESCAIQAEIEEMIKLKVLSRDDEAIIAAWIRQISYHGPESIRSQSKWNDHELKAEWAGYRSSSFSNRGRIIYRIENRIVKIKVARITNSHDYKRGKKS